MSTFLYDLRYLQAAVDVLQDFLFSPEIYWPIGIQPPMGETPYPQLTLGGISLALVRIESTGMPSVSASCIAIDVRLPPISTDPSTRLTVPSGLRLAEALDLPP